MKNIVFDLGGVLFARDPKRCRREVLEFFSFIREEPMPQFWVDFDCGLNSFDDVCRILAERSGAALSTCRDYLLYSIERQEVVAPTGELVADLKSAGYRLYVLSNMAREFIDFLRRMPVYANFDGEVISCEEHVAKPSLEIYRILLSRYGLDPAQTLFIDDRQTNVDAARTLGINAFRFDEPLSSCARLRAMLL